MMMMMMIVIMMTTTTMTEVDQFSLFGELIDRRLYNWMPIK